MKNNKIAKISAGITIIILLISYYLGTSVIFNAEQLNKNISGIIGIGVIMGVVTISLLLTTLINWILRKIIK